MDSIRNIVVSIIVMMLYFAALVSMHDAWNAVALYAVLPCAFMLTFLKSGIIKANNSFATLMILYMWILFVALFTTDVALTVRQLKQIVGCIIVSYIVAIQAKNEKVIPWLYVVYVILYAVCIEYAMSNIVDTIEIGEERVDDEKLNANTLAYYTFYNTFILFIFGEIMDHKWIGKLFRILFFAIIPISLWIAYITASRQVLILQVPLFVILMFMRYWNYGSKKSKLFIVIFSCLLIMVSSKYIVPIFQDSLLMERAEDIGEDSRLRLISEAIDIGFSNPIVGVGPGCVRLYTSDGAFSHNTFLELFAGTGLIGMIIFMVMLWRFLSVQIKRYMVTKDKMFMYFFIFGLFFVFDQIFFVFYAQLWLISFFMLVASHSETYFHLQYKKLIYD